jgi:hypothetical protein
MAGFLSVLKTATVLDEAFKNVFRNIRACRPKAAFPVTIK